MKEQDLVEQYEDWEYWGDSRDRKGGSGGKKKKFVSAARSDAKRTEAREGLQKNREADSLQQIFPRYRRISQRDRSASGTAHCDAYGAWLVRVLSGGQLVEDDELRMADTTSGGPGGQGRQHVKQAVWGWHEPTGVQILGKKSRGQAANRENVRERMTEALQTDLLPWRVLTEQVSGEDEIRQRVAWAFGRLSDMLRTSESPRK